MICDLHNDFLGELKDDDIQRYIDKANGEGVQFLNSSFWTTKVERPLCKLQERISHIKNWKCARLHIEDVGFLKSEAEVFDLIKLKPFSVSLTWNNDNQFAGGALGEGKLTKNGRSLIKFLQKNDIFIDLSHLNKNSFYSAIEILCGGALVTHAGFCGVNKHPRNLDDEQIKKVIEKNGFIGLFFYDNCTKVTKDFSALDIAVNVAWFAERFGTDNLGLGSDFFGIETAPRNLKDYGDFANLEFELKKLGFSPGEIEKIFCANFKSFLWRDSIDIITP